MLYTSKDNPKIKNLKKLQDKKYRKEMGLFIIETPHLIEEAYKNNLLEELVLLDGIKSNIDVPTNYVDEKTMKFITNLTTPSTMLGVCKFKEEKEIGNKVLVLDEIQDPGNLGTIIRSAVAFNVDTIILGNNTVDLYNPKVVRASEGMLFNINIINKDLEIFIPELKKQGYKIVGTKVTNGKNVKTLEKNNKICIIMGNEGSGVKENILNLCDEYIYIDMNNKCESLNVSVATSIILYELDK